jgi:hypothetical protein
MGQLWGQNMDFNEVLRVFLRVIQDWRVIVITAAVLIYLVIVVSASSTRKKTIVKRLSKVKFQGFKMPKINIKFPKKKAKEADDEENEDELDERRGERRK